MKKDTFYFSHDATAKDDPKCMLLIDQLGLEGYGIFWVLVETLRNQPDYKCPVNVIPSIARRYNTTQEKMKAVLNGYGLFVIEDDSIFFSESLMRRMCQADQKRAHLSQSGKKGNEVRWGKQEENRLSSPPDSHPIASKVNESKVKEIKEKESNIHPKVPFGDMKSFYLGEYEKRVGSPFYWTAKEAFHLNQLGVKILFKIKEKEKSLGSKEKEDYQQDILDGFKHMINACKDKWIQDQFSIPIFNSKFNEIFTQILTSNGTTKANRFFDAVEKLYPNK